MMDIGKDLQDAYERGRQDALAEMMEYTYGMLTSEKFGLQHKIKSMMTECNEPNSSEKPNNCEPQTDDLIKQADDLIAFEKEWLEMDGNCLTCRYNSDEWDSPKCDGCSKAHSNYEPQTDLLVKTPRKSRDSHEKNCETCKWWYLDEHCGMTCMIFMNGDLPCHYEPKDEPQTDMAEDIVRSFGFKTESYRQAKAKTEPQTKGASK